MALEWHAHGCPDGDPRQLATTLLERSGLTVSIAQRAADGLSGTLWAWRAGG